MAGHPAATSRSALPNTSYMSLASPATIPSLAPGASSTVTLELSPAANLPLEEYTGTIAVSGSQTGISVPFTFTAITSAVGNVYVLVDDDYTFEEAGSPHVQGATVSLLNPYDNTDRRDRRDRRHRRRHVHQRPRRSLRLAGAGDRPLQLRELLSPSFRASRTTTRCSSQRQFVSYTWNVVQTTIQDTYQIQLQTEVSDGRAGTRGHHLRAGLDSDARSPANREPSTSRSPTTA